MQRRAPVVKSALPLDSLTVVSLEQAVAAPFATRQLADLGARVIKVERPDGGDFARRYDESVRGQSSYFVWLNRSKESVTLDVKQPLGRRVLDELVAKADVFVHNLGPGAVDRLGLGAEELTSRHPRLVHCTISGYGTTGSDAHRKAYDLLVQAEAGLLSITGTPEAPARAGISVADIAAGMYAYSGILAALFQRERTGRGAALEVSLLDALAEWMGNPVYYAKYSGVSPARVGAQHATIAPYGAFPTADGTIMLAVQNEREWQRLCERVLEAPDLAQADRFATNARRCAHREELNERIAQRTRGMTSAQALDALAAAGIACAQLNDLDGLIAHPALRSRDRWRSIDTPGGAVEALLPPVTTGAEPRMGAVPALGAHTDTVLAELGFDDEGIDELRAAGAV